VKDFQKQVVYPVLVAAILATGGTLFSMYTNQIQILANLENLRKDIHQVNKFLDDHERRGH
jgi:cell division protein FtsL